MKNLVPANRFSLLFAFLVLFLLQYGSAHAYTTGEADEQLREAARQLTNPTPGRPLPWANCASAERSLDQADVTIDQILRDRTMRGCIARPLNDLEGLAIRLSNLGRILQRDCGMRRSYDNTVVKVRSWENTPPCGPPNIQQRCQQYADTAVRQNQLNISKGCGFTGRRWTSIYNGHYNWCLSVSENAAHQETQARKILLDNCAVPGACNRFIGSWTWFTNITVQISGDYRFSTSGNNGTWRCLPNGNIEMHWKNGGWVDTLSITPDGNSLSGSNQYGTAVSARRNQGMWYNVWQGPYGGGRLCLTEEQAAKIRNDPHTVKIEPVGGLPCSP